MIQIFHNPRCGKSRECLAFMENSGKEYEIVRYLVDIPTFDELSGVVRKLGIPPMELVRTKEPEWEGYKGRKLADTEIIQAMVDHPILIERPIVINGNKAVIARPWEKATDII
jgi:arsenate reductase (glutaredoxin)